MKLKTTALTSTAFLICFGATAASAADVADPAPAPSAANTISLEASPEFYDLANPGKNAAGDLDDINFKLAVSHTFSNNVVLGGDIQYTQRAAIANVASSVDQAEVTLGYKLKLDAVTLTPGVLLGYGFGDEPKINPANNFNPDAYWAVTLAGDFKLNSQWTWNVFNVRYRNAFDYTWITPKITTGITYNIDKTDAVYFNIGNAWKDKGDGNGLVQDKYNITVGYKYSF
jgi:hypothetical protein